MIARLDERRMVVCCGAGGVGKTTVSAAIGLALARAGHRTAVVTIDPARRLATALGIGELGDEPRRVSDPSAGAGELWALQLDAKATFDRLVARHAPDEEARQRILANRIYRHLSGTVAGSQEYMAVERLHELVDQGGFDRIVLDTPPAQNALDFLDAPRRMVRFIEGRALRLLVRGPRSGRRMLQFGSNTVLSVLERITGAQLLHDVSEFLTDFDGMYQGFADRAERIRALLASDHSAFVIITAPGEAPLRQAVALHRRLRADGLPLLGTVLNRVHGLPQGGAPGRAPLVAALEAQGVADAAGLGARMAICVNEARTRAVHDLDCSEALRIHTGATALAHVPALAAEPADLAGLAAIARALGG